MMAFTLISVAVFLASLFAIDMYMKAKLKNIGKNEPHP